MDSILFNTPLCQKASTNDSLLTVVLLRRSLSALSPVCVDGGVDGNGCSEHEGGSGEEEGRVPFYRDGILSGARDGLLLVFTPT